MVTSASLVKLYGAARSQKYELIVSDLVEETGTAAGEQAGHLVSKVYYKSNRSCTGREAGSAFLIA